MRAGGFAGGGRLAGAGSPAVGGSPGAAAAPGAADARFAVLHGLYWLVANLAAERPLLLLVDDAQWVDEPSLRFLAYLGRRVRELPVAVVLAARPALPGEDRAVLEVIAAAAEALAPAPLTAAAIGVLAARRFGAEPGPAFVAACLRATGGNALLVEEVLAELDEPDADAVVAAGVERVGRRVARRLAALGDGAGPLAAAVAVLGDGCELPLAAALAGAATSTTPAGPRPSSRRPTCSRTRARCASATRWSGRRSRSSSPPSTTVWRIHAPPACWPTGTHRQG